MFLSWVFKGFTFNNLVFCYLKKKSKYDNEMQKKLLEQMQQKTV